MDRNQAHREARSRQTADGARDARDQVGFEADTGREVVTECGPPGALAYVGVRFEVTRSYARRLNFRHGCASNRGGLTPAAFALLTE